MSLNRRLVLLAIGITATAAFALSRLPSPAPLTPKANRLRSVAVLVEQTGKPEQVPANAVKFFKLGDTELGFQEVRMKAPSGAVRACQVRRNDSGGYDIFLVHHPAGAEGAYHFLATDEGGLTRACYFDSAPTRVSNALDRFEHEVQFWLEWLREKNNRSPI